MITQTIWEILVPASSPEYKIKFEQHKAWDDKVKSIVGGVTILKSGKGEWISPSGSLCIDRVIPCRIICTQEQIEEIARFTIEHYKQEAVCYYKISDGAHIMHKSEVD